MNRRMGRMQEIPDCPPGTEDYNSPVSSPEDVEMTMEDVSLSDLSKEQVYALIKSVSQDSALSVEKPLNLDFVTLEDGSQKSSMSVVKRNFSCAVLCYPCLVSFSPSDVENHVNGRKHGDKLHSRKIWSLSMFENHPFFLKFSCSQDGELKKRLEGYQQSPILGLEYLIEINSNKSHYNYYCVLCETKGMSQTIINHIVGKIHSTKYLQIHFPSAYRKISDFLIIKSLREGVKQVLRTVCMKIEQTYGRSNPMVVTEDDFNQHKTVILNQVRAKSKHYSEKDGDDFTSLIDEKYIRTISENAPEEEEVSSENTKELLKNLHAAVEENKTVHRWEPSDLRNSLTNRSHDSDSGYRFDIDRQINISPKRSGSPNMKIMLNRDLSIWERDKSPRFSRHYREQRSPPIRRSRSPRFYSSRMRSRSPRFRSRSPRFRSRSPIFRGRSPGFRDRSPGPRGRSPGPRGRSPGPRGRSPVPRGRSPGFRNRSPGFRGRSPGPRGRSPGPRGRSPGQRGRSPRPRGRSPGPRGRPRSQSPRFRGLSPAFKNRPQEFSLLSETQSISQSPKFGDDEAAYNMPKFSLLFNDDDMPPKNPSPEKNKEPIIKNVLSRSTSLGMAADFYLQQSATSFNPREPESLRSQFPQGPDTLSSTLASQDPSVEEKPKKRVRGTRRGRGQALRRILAKLGPKTTLGKTPMNISKEDMKIHYKLTTYRQRLEELEKKYVKITEYFEKNPEKHPQYQDEWKKYWNTKFKELKMENKDPSKHDFKPDWIIYWKIRMLKLINEEKEALKKQMRTNLGLESLGDSWNDDEILNSQNVKNSPDVRPSQTNKSGDVILIPDSPPGGRRSRSKSPDQKLRSKSPKGIKRRSRSRSRSRSARNRRQDSRDRDRKRRSVSPVKKDDDIFDDDMNVISLLRLVTALEDYLGSLGPKVVDLLALGLKMEKEMPNSSETILQMEGYSVLLETVKEKLKGQLQAKLIESKAISSARCIIRNIAKLLHQASLEAKKQKAFGTKNRITVEGIGNLEKQTIAVQIAKVLTAQGRKNITHEELERLTHAVVGKANESNISNIPMATAGFLEGLTAHEKALLFTSELNKTNTSANALTAIQVNYAQKTEALMDQLSDSDLKTLLQNFSKLSEEEQQRLVTYLKKIERIDAKRVECLRQYIVIPDQDDNHREMSPFESQDSSINQPGPSTAFQKISDDEEDYTFDDVVKAVQQKDMEDKFNLIQKSLQASQTEQSDQSSKPFDPLPSTSSNSEPNVAKDLLSNLMSTLQQQQKSSSLQIGITMQQQNQNNNNSNILNDSSLLNVLSIVHQLQNAQKQQEIALSQQLVDRVAAKSIANSVVVSDESMSIVPSKPQQSMETVIPYNANANMNNPANMNRALQRRDPRMMQNRYLNYSNNSPNQGNNWNQNQNANNYNQNNMMSSYNQNSSMTPNTSYSQGNQIPSNWGGNQNQYYGGPTSTSTSADNQNQQQQLQYGNNQNQPQQQYGNNQQQQYGNNQNQQQQYGNNQNQQQQKQFETNAYTGNNLYSKTNISTNNSARGGVNNPTRGGANNSTRGVANNSARGGTVNRGRGAANNPGRGGTANNPGRGGAGNRGRGSFNNNRGGGGNNRGRGSFS